MMHYIVRYTQVFVGSAFRLPAEPVLPIASAATAGGSEIAENLLLLLGHAARLLRLLEWPNDTKRCTIYQ